MTNRSGEPGTYQTTLNGETPVGDSFGLGKPGVTRAYTHDGFNGAAAQSGASIEQTIEVEEGKEQELELGLTLNGSVVMGAKLAKHELFGGLCFGANAGFTTGNSSSESTEYGGTVDNLPEAAQASTVLCGVWASTRWMSTSSRQTRATSSAPRTPTSSGSWAMTLRTSRCPTRRP